MWPTKVSRKERRGKITFGSTLDNHGDVTSYLISLFRDKPIEGRGPCGDGNRRDYPVIRETLKLENPIGRRVFFTYLLLKGHYWKLIGKLISLSKVRVKV